MKLLFSNKFSERGYPRFLLELGTHLGFVQLGLLVRKYLFRQMHGEEEGDVPSSFLPGFNPRTNVFHSATAAFYAPSDPSGVGGMRREQIRCTPCWRNEAPRYDTVFLETDPGQPGMRGLHVARVYLLFSFDFKESNHTCALVNWFIPLHNIPDKLTGMWVVSPEFTYDDELSFVRRMKRERWACVFVKAWDADDCTASP